MQREKNQGILLLLLLALGTLLNATHVLSFRVFNRLHQTLLYGTHCHGAGESKANRVCVPDLMGLVGWRNGDCAEGASCEATTLPSFGDKV